MGFLRFADVTDFEFDDEEKSLQESASHQKIGAFRLVDFTTSSHGEEAEEDEENEDLDAESECSCEICCCSDIGVNSSRDRGHVALKMGVASQETPP